MLWMSTNSLTAQPIGSIGCSSTSCASYNSVTCGMKFVFARRLKPARVIAAASIRLKDVSCRRPASPKSTNGRLPGLPRKLTVRSNQTSNGFIRTSATASHALRRLCSGKPPRKKSETCRHSASTSLPSKLWTRFRLPARSWIAAAVLASGTAARNNRPTSGRRSMTLYQCEIVDRTYHEHLISSMLARGLPKRRFWIYYWIYI